MIYPQKLLFWSWLLKHWITLSTGHDWINHYPADMNYREAICVIENYPVDSVIRLSNFLRWLLFFSQVFSYCGSRPICSESTVVPTHIVHLQLTQERNVQGLEQTFIVF